MLCVCECVPICLIFFCSCVSPSSPATPCLSDSAVPLPHDVCPQSLSLGSRGWVFCSINCFILLFPSAQWGLQPAILLLSDEEAVAKRQWNVSTWPSRKKIEGEKEEKGIGGGERPGWNDTHSKSSCSSRRDSEIPLSSLPSRGADEKRVKEGKKHGRRGTIIATVVKKKDLRWV